MTDVVAIIVCAIATWLAWAWVGPLALIAPLALGHFFLFCNVFRIRRSYELIWAASLILNFLVQTYFANTGQVNYFAILAVQTPITLFLIGLELRSQRYHGIASRRINPHLERYLRGEIE